MMEKILTKTITQCGKSFEQKKKNTLNAKDFIQTMTAMQSISTRRTIAGDNTGYVFLSFENFSLNMHTSDLEMTIANSIECNFFDELKNNEEAYGVQSKKIFDIVRETTKQELNFVFEKNENSLEIDDQSFFARLPTIPYITQEEIKNGIENIFSIKKEIFLETLIITNSAIASVQKNDSVFNGILLEVYEAAVKITATDGYCLSNTTISLSNESIVDGRDTETMSNLISSFVISKRAFCEIGKIIQLLSGKEIDIVVGKTDEKLVISGERFSIFIRQIKEKTPDYNKILNTSNHFSISLNSQELTPALRRINSLNSDSFLPTKFIIDTKNKEMKIIFDGGINGYIEETMYIDCLDANINENNLPHVEFLANSSYMLNAANATSGKGREKEEKIKIYLPLDGKKKPAIFFKEDPEYKRKRKYAVMPVMG